MNIFSKIYCRTYQTIFKIFLPFFPYIEPKLLNSYEEIIQVLKENGYDNVMLVTGKTIRKLGLTQKLETLFSDNKIAYTVFNDIQVNPTTQNVEDGVVEYIRNKCQCLIALGGGSVIDCAKGIGARIACPNRTLKDMAGLLKVNRMLPMLTAIPTTAGTGSETTLSAVITCSETHHKFVINDFDLIPNYALLDANLTVGLPQKTTATTALDALTHAIEAYIGGTTTPTTRKHALKAIKLIFENLELAYNDETNLEARENLLKASYMAGLAFSKSYVGYVHAIAHSLGGKYNLAHGFANAIILPTMLKHYGKSIHKKLYKIAKYTGLCDDKTQKDIAAKMVIEKIENMNKTFKLPNKIKEIVLEDIPDMAKTAAKEANPLYPVPKLMNAKELERVYLDLMK